MPRFTHPRALAALVAVALPLSAGATVIAKDKDKRRGRGAERTGQRSFTYAIPGDAVFPEGITVDKNAKRFYVTSTSDGTIFRGPVKGSRAEVFLPGGEDGRTTAIGTKVDREGRLYVAGGSTGSIFVYDTGTRELLAKFDTGPGGFLNDIAITKDGTAYVTDSQRDRIFRVTEKQVEAGGGTPASFALEDPTPSGFGANGIVPVRDGTVIYVQSNTGQLFLVEDADGPSPRRTEIDLGAARLTNGDGLVLKGRTLYVVRNVQELIAEVRLAGDLESGRVVGETTDPTFAFPTTAALAKGRLLVVNSQFDKRSAGAEPEPFTVSSIKKP